MDTAAQKACERSVVVRLHRTGETCSGFLLKHAKLDASGDTVTLTGPKSAFSDLHTGDSLYVMLANGVVLPAKVTHIHADHDRYRGELSALSVSAAGIDLSDELALKSVPDGLVAHVDPLRQRLKGRTW